MKCSELAVRYAKALYETSSDPQKQEQIFQEIRVIDAVFEKETGIRDFLTSPLVSAEEREQVVQKALKDLQLSAETKNFVVLLAHNGRLKIFGEIVHAFQAKADQDNDVVRGTVRSAVVLAPEERKKIEKKVSEITKRQAILTYREDTSVIGGLIAEIGSYTFDDTLQSHMLRLQEDLKRSAH
jgi:F-type H+-transporting ATPase subunit delta